MTEPWVTENKGAVPWAFTEQPNKWAFDGDAHLRGHWHKGEYVAPRVFVFVPTTWNPSDKGDRQSLSGGNLIVTGTGTPPVGAYQTVRSVVGVISGKPYWEDIITNDGAYNVTRLGISEADIAHGANVNANELGIFSSGYAYKNNGHTYHGGTDVAYGDTYATGDTIGVAHDVDDGKLWFSKNGVWQASGNPATGANPAYSGIPAGSYFAAAGTIDNTSVHTANFGASPFVYPVPDGFNAGLGVWV